MSKPIPTYQEFMRGEGARAGLVQVLDMALAKLGVDWGLTTEEVYNALAAGLEALERAGMEAGSRITGSTSTIII